MNRDQKQAPLAHEVPVIYVDDQAKYCAQIGIPLMTQEEAGGVGMMDFLFRLKGIEKTYAQILEAWRKFSAEEKQATSKAYTFYRQHRN